MDVAIVDLVIPENQSQEDNTDQNSSDVGTSTEVVETNAVLDGMVTEILRYLAIPRDAAEVMALWVLHTHVFGAWTHTPRLAFLSPVLQCGKTRALSILEILVAKPHFSSSITGPGVFRLVQKDHPTLLLDEVDTYLESNEELRNVLNSGHEISGAATRCVGNNYIPTRFSTWAPLALGMIGNLPDTVKSRAIVIQMKRRRADEDPVEDFHPARARELKTLKRKAIVWGSQNLKELTSAQPQVPDGLNNRAADNWKPLIAIGDLAGAEWAEKSRRLAIAFSGADSESPTPIQLLSDIKTAIGEVAGAWISSDLLYTRLTHMADRPWGDNQSDSSIRSLHALALRLRPFGIKPMPYRDGDSTRRGYLLAEFEDAFARYPD
jgi:hypothetical protein